MVRLLSLLTLVLSIVLFPPAVLALISNNAVPGDRTYPIKRSLEGVILAVASINPTTRAWFSQTRSDRRFKEYTTLINQNKKASETLQELLKQTSDAADSIKNVSDKGQKRKLIDQLSKSVDKYDKGLQEVVEPTTGGSSGGVTAQPTAAPDIRQPQATPTVIFAPPSKDKETQKAIDDARKQLEEIRKQLVEQGKQVAKAQTTTTAPPAAAPLPPPQEAPPPPAAAPPSPTTNPTVSLLAEGGSVSPQRASLRVTPETNYCKSNCQDYLQTKTAGTTEWCRCSVECGDLGFCALQPPCVSAGFCSAADTGADGPDAPPPPPVAALGVSASCSGNQLTLNWGQVSGSVNYTIRVNRDPQEEWVPEYTGTDCSSPTTSSATGDRACEAGNVLSKTVNLGSYSGNFGGTVTAQNGTVQTFAVITCGS